MYFYHATCSSLYMSTFPILKKLTFPWQQEIRLVKKKTRKNEHLHFIIYYTLETTVTEYLYNP